MITKRGSYPGASEFAHFDKELTEMSHEALVSLLQFILFEASPGEQDSDVVYEHLARAEAKAREQGVRL